METLMLFECRPGVGALTMPADFARLGWTAALAGEKEPTD